MFYKTVEFICAGGSVADGNRYNVGEIGDIIHVIAPVRSLNHIRGKERHPAVFIARVLFFAVGDAFIPPIAKIIYRGGPADIIPKTIYISPKMVMRTVKIYPVSEYVGFSVRNVFP